MRTLNLGILAHVDAGKTTLTERLLFGAGVIDAVGSVDRGTTRTDTLELERERGITIKSAVVSFALGGESERVFERANQHYGSACAHWCAIPTARSNASRDHGAPMNVNLIDTPGHPDFIAEVDRALALLDGVVLVVSAVEGVQGQTRVLMRALRRLGIPTLIFVNKVDRSGADDVAVVDAISRKLSAGVVAMERIDRIGTGDAAVVSRSWTDAAFRDEIIAALADHDDEVLAHFVDGRDESVEGLRGRLATWTRRGVVHPVFFGSALTGTGVGELLEGIVELLPSPERAATDPVSGIVFKTERGTTGERLAIVKLLSGRIRIRDKVPVGDDVRRVTDIGVFEHGALVPSKEAVGGQFARLAGLGGVRIGDAIGKASENHHQQFSPPPFEALAVPARDDDRRALRVALDVLSEDDPLINVRQDDRHDTLTVSLYGEVQREVLSETLRRQFGIDVRFSDTTTVCIERLAGRGEATEMMFQGRSATTPFLAGVGLRVEPADDGAGVTFATGVERGRLPMAFITAVEEAVRETLRQGLRGWEIPDCTASMTASGYAPRQSHAHATFDKNMSSTAGDFRLLTPLVLMQAIRSAGTIVHEPVHRFHLEAPPATLGPLTAALAATRADLETPSVTDSAVIIRGLLPAARLNELRHRLPRLTHGDGFVESSFDSYRPVNGVPPTRARTDDDPLDRHGYLRAVLNRI